MTHAWLEAWLRWYLSLMDMSEIGYEERRSRRAKKISLTVRPDRRVIVTIPSSAGPDEARLFVERYADWIADRLERFARLGDCACLPRGRRDYLKHKESARSFVASRLMMFNSFYGFAYGRVSIKNLTRNWGSCSALGNLNYNYKLIHLPECLAEYIVVHELCHLAEFNHSPRFWNLVARSVPDHKERRKTLRRYLM